jgi:hypothetical protein
VQRSEMVQGSHGSVRCFRLPPGLRVPQVEEHWYMRHKFIYKEFTICESIQPLILSGIEVLTAVVIKSSISLDITTCSPSKDNLRFGEIYGPYIQGRISQA